MGAGAFGLDQIDFVQKLLVRRYVPQLARMIGVFLEGPVGGLVQGTEKGVAKQHIMSEGAGPHGIYHDGSRRSAWRPLGELLAGRTAPIPESRRRVARQPGKGARRRGRSSSSRRPRRPLSRALPSLG